MSVKCFSSGSYGDDKEEEKQKKRMKPFFCGSSLLSSRVCKLECGEFGLSFATTARIVVIVARDAVEEEEPGRG